MKEITVYDYMSKICDINEYSQFYHQITKNTKLIIDDGMEEYASNARRPYYRLRGKKITEDQAFEIIRRTDRLSPWSLEIPCDDLIEPINIRNNWTRNNYYPSPSGWVHPDGIIGINDITGKYPELEELIDDLLILIHYFPYLDFVMAITSWDEIPPYLWKKLSELRNHTYDDYPDFFDNIMIGFWVHNGTIEVMSPERTAIVYSEYDKKYGEKNQKIYCPEYYMDFQPDVISDDFVKRCYNAYGVDEIPETSEWFRKK